MAYWLLKTEPDTFSWDTQVERGPKGEPWSGVRNFTARRYMKEMQKGDRAFAAQFVHYKAVVNDFLADVNRRSEGLKRDADDINGPHYPGAKTPWLGEHNPDGRPRVHAVSDDCRRWPGSAMPTAVCRTFMLSA